MCDGDCDSFHREAEAGAGAGTRRRKGRKRDKEWKCWRGGLGSEFMQRERMGERRASSVVVAKVLGMSQLELGQTAKAGKQHQPLLLLLLLEDRTKKRKKNDSPRKWEAACETAIRQTEPQAMSPLLGPRPSSWFPGKA